MSETARTAVILVAAGEGLRLGGPAPKQYQRLGAEMILTRSLRAVLAASAVDHVVCVIHRDARARYDEAAKPVDDPRLLPPVPGGDTRAASVLEGLRALVPHRPTRVLIHDAARPFLPRSLLDRLCAATDAAIPAVPIADALWREADAHADAPVPRAGLWRAQTPQAFPFEAILAAHEAEADAPSPALDDAETLRRAGGTVRPVPGDPDNFKITDAADMDRARHLVGADDTRMEIRTGHGFDVHRFAPGDFVRLCGVRVPHVAGLEGHSDADVGLHALADAIYGALAEGDIGAHFPPSDDRWKDAGSHVFLAHAAERIAARGGRLVNADITLLCERPRIAPHAAAMRVRMAGILGAATDRLSVKATTMERMGFIGREEGMGCIATASIALPETP